MTNDLFLKSKEMLRLIRRLSKPLGSNGPLNSNVAVQAFMMKIVLVVQMRVPHQKSTIGERRSESEGPYCCVAFQLYGVA